MPLVHCFGGGGTPDVPPTPKPQQPKSISAGAQAAADAQRDKAKRNRGLAASILTSRSGLADNGTNTGSDTLG